MTIATFADPKAPTVFPLMIIGQGRRWRVLTKFFKY